MAGESTRRFSSRVENYIRFRPSYPPGVLEVLRAAGDLADGAVIADIGSGTGIFSELLLADGFEVFSVEPNDEMRGAAEKLLAGVPGFTSVKGTAEATTLADLRVAAITAAQAFHWFERPRARAEFRRILQPGGLVALIWNDRQLGSTPFLRDYEQLLRDFGTDYIAVRNRDLDLADVQAFMETDEVRLTVLESAQDFDYAGVEGRLLSSSYAPETGHPTHEPMLARLRELFDRDQQDGHIEMRYDTRVFTGRFPAA